MTVHRLVPLLTAGLFATCAFAQAQTLNQGVSAQDTLAAHNAERQKYPGVGPLQWSSALQQYAQDWANRLARNDAAEHRQDQTNNPVAPGQWVGENLYWGDGADFAGPDAVASWISEKQWYHYDLDDGYAGYSNTPPGCTPPAGAYCGHLTQVIWKGTQIVGCGKASAKDYTVYIVCNYYPSGNWAGQKPY